MNSCVCSLSPRHITVCVLHAPCISNAGCWRLAPSIHYWAQFIETNSQQFKNTTTKHGIPQFHLKMKMMTNDKLMKQCDARIGNVSSQNFRVQCGYPVVDEPHHQYSLYSDKEVFLQELISNASDALVKVRYESITDPEKIGAEPRFVIEIIPVKKTQPSPLRFPALT